MSGKRLRLLRLSLLAGGALHAASVDPGLPTLEQTLAQRLPQDGPGEAILIARDGKVLFSRGYGLADREKKQPVTTGTRFRIGSVTKQFTAAAILQLAEEGKLSIDDALAKYFPGYPGGDRITLRHLLTHTSGLHSFTAAPDFLSRVVRPIAPADLIASFRDDPPAFATIRRILRRERSFVTAIPGISCSGRSWRRSPVSGWTLIGRPDSSARLG